MPKNLKKLVGERRAKTGESYQAALRHVRNRVGGGPPPPPPPTFEDRVHELIGLSRKRREEHDSRRAAQDASESRLTLEPTSCERQIQELLGSFSERDLKKLQALMHSGREDESVLLCHRDLPPVASTIRASMLFEKLPLADYLERGLARAHREGIDLNGDFDSLYAARVATARSRSETDREWERIAQFYGDVRELFRPPRIFDGARFDAPELRERVRPATAIEIAQSALHDLMVVITGPSGVGKSSLAAAMQRALPRAARIADFEVSLDGWGSVEDPQTPAYVARTAPTFIVDDIGVGRSYEGMSADPVNVTLGRAIKERHTRRQQTIITTIDRDMLARQLGDDVAEIAFSGTIIALDPDYRWKMAPGIDV